MRNLKEKIEALPPDEREKVEHLVMDLLNKNGSGNIDAIRRHAGSLDHLESEKINVFDEIIAERASFRDRDLNL